MNDRHIQWYSQQLADLLPDIYGAGLPAALRTINQNLDNIRQAWRTAATRGNNWRSRHPARCPARRPAIR